MPRLRDRLRSLVSTQTPLPQSAANPASTVTIGTTSSQLAASNPARVKLWVTNTHASNVLYLSFGTGAAVVGSGVRVGPTSTVIIDSYAGAVQAIASAITTTVGLTEV